MRVGVVDAELMMNKGRHNFPNLCSMKLSAYHKSLGDEVELLKSPADILLFDKVYVSKVFTSTPDVPNSYLPHVIRGGTGYFYDKAEPLPDAVEHIMPDYTLYKGLGLGAEYENSSIGYLTRGCFRRCGFCVNQKYDHVFRASELEEFLDENQRYIVMNDDNFFGFPGWKRDLEKLIATGKPFKFKQGLDERILTDEKCEVLFSAKYWGDYTFAFDKIEDYDLIESKLRMIRRYAEPQVIPKFYVLVGYKSTGLDDIAGMFKRIELLAKYGAIPYIMRYQSPTEAPYKNSEWAGVYTQVARWCNQASFIKKESLYRYIMVTDKAEGTNKASMRALRKLEEDAPDLYAKYAHWRWEDARER